jgi:hypothetical protein
LWQRIQGILYSSSWRLCKRYQATTCIEFCDHCICSTYYIRHHHSYRRSPTVRLTCLHANMYSRYSFVFSICSQAFCSSHKEGKKIEGQCRVVQCIPYLEMLEAIQAQCLQGTCYNRPCGSTKINTNEHTIRVTTTPQTLHSIYIKRLNHKGLV